MKKLQFALISLIIISSIGCGSTPVQEQDTSINAPTKVEAENKRVEESSKKSKEELPGIYFINKQTKQKLRIEDWKYMGFGEELPSWVVPSLEGDEKAVKKAVPLLKDSVIQILIAPGCNRDQADNAMHDLETPEGYTLYDSFWIRVSDDKNKNALDMPYISVALYYINSIES